MEAQAPVVVSIQRSLSSTQEPAVAAMTREVQAVEVFRTIAQCHEHMLTPKETQQAITGHWPTPSSSYSKLTERLLAFFAARHPQRSNLQYIGKLLRRFFGETHVGRAPKPAVEQQLQRHLRARYLPAEECCRKCQRCFAPPCCGGAYDDSALGFLQWWCVCLSVPAVLFLVAGFILAFWMRYTYIRGGDLSPLLNISQETDTMVTWSLDLSKVSDAGRGGFAAIELSIEGSPSNGLEFTPEIKIDALGEAGANATIDWLIVDAKNVVVHRTAGKHESEGRLRISASVRAESAGCIVESASDATCRWISTQREQMKFAFSTTEPNNCVVDHAGSCGKISPGMQFPKGGGTVFHMTQNKLSLRGFAPPLRLLLRDLQVVLPRGQTSVGPIEITFFAQLREETVAAVFFAIGSVLFAMFLLFLLVTMWAFVTSTCCYTERVYTEVLDTTGSKEGTAKRRTYKRRRVDTGDSLFLQLYLCLYCGEVFFYCFVYVLPLAGELCSKLGSLFAHCVNSCNGCCACCASCCMECCGEYCGVCGVCLGVADCNCKECCDACRDCCHACGHCGDICSGGCDCGGCDCAC